MGPWRKMFSYFFFSAHAAVDKFVPQTLKEYVRVSKSNVGEVQAHHVDVSYFYCPTPRPNCSGVRQEPISAVQVIGVCSLTARNEEIDSHSIPYFTHDRAHRTVRKSLLVSQTLFNAFTVTLETCL